MNGKSALKLCVNFVVQKGVLPSVPHQRLLKLLKLKDTEVDIEAVRKRLTEVETSATGSTTLKHVKVSHAGPCACRQSKANVSAPCAPLEHAGGNSFFWGEENSH